jgi:nucleotide-binding universal stress UspA family protein
MFGEVIVGVNFGPGGDAALALALRLMSRGGRMTLTNVVASDPTVFRGRRDDIVAAERARSLSLLERERSLVRLDAGDESPPGIETSAPVAASASRGLHAVARRRGADLIVVGASRCGGLGGVLFGDDTRATLRGAPCAVAVAPRGWARGQTVRRIGVGDDPQAVAMARVLAARHDLEVLVVGGDTAGLSRQVDLLVVGPGRPGRWRRPAARRSSERLARVAACPLLVLGPPPGARPAGGSPAASCVP